ncbi:penicillin-binding protein activator [Roseomonas aerophila]|uniref:Penicillin-binding protein activator n=1 Tax=Teichococcus aerophilus TaxID=1224513 RepID=A0ABR7RS72_9PROT|nr:penicillin-binding protein activator [Pseudoroseomonas aerophila]MBC9209191.1 penicillin-binding protein activator [Pseudoroseomonas aerophila]
MRRAALALGALVALSACAPQASGPVFSGGVAPAPGGGLPPGPPPRTKVALLLPLTGSNAALGQAMLNAAQLALFEQGAPGFEFVPRDTGGTSQGAAEAARSAIAGGARVLVGPLTSAETSAAAVPARAASVPMLPFTNDSNQATPLVWPLGITPAQQMRRLVAAANAQGATRFALAAPSGAFGRQLAAGLQSAAKDLGLPAPLMLSYPAAAAPALAARDVAAQLQPGEGGAPRADVLILSEAGTRAREFAAGLVAGGVAVPPMKLAGTSLWAQDTTLAQEAALNGAWFPGGDPNARAQFESRFQAAFGERPSRVVGVAYDAAAIAARAIRGQPDAVPPMPVGEMILGADGAFRLGPNGEVQRALAVFALTPGIDGQVVQPAELPGTAAF